MALKKRDAVEPISLSQTASPTVRKSWQAPGIDQRRDDLEHAADAAYNAVTKTPWTEKARYLQELFGQREAAVIAGVRDAKTVGRWIRGDQLPQPAQQKRLAAAFQIAKLIEIATTRSLAQAWFLGMNPGLDDQQPAMVIANDPDGGGQRVMQAARTFLASQ
jgi:hypothetical protein